MSLGSEIHIFNSCNALTDSPLPLHNDFNSVCALVGATLDTYQRFSHTTAQVCMCMCACECVSKKIFFALFATSQALHAASLTVFATKFGFSRRCICLPVHSCLFWHHFCAHCLLISHLFAHHLHNTLQMLTHTEF